MSQSVFYSCSTRRMMKLNSHNLVNSKFGALPMFTLDRQCFPDASWEKVGMHVQLRLWWSCYPKISLVTATSGCISNQPNWSVKLHLYSTASVLLCVAVAEFPSLHHLLHSGTAISFNLRCSALGWVAVDKSATQLQRNTDAVEYEQTLRTSIATKQGEQKFLDCSIWNPHSHPLWKTFL